MYSSRDSFTLKTIVHPRHKVDLLECRAGNGIRGKELIDDIDGFSGRTVVFSKIFPVICIA